MRIAVFQGPGVSGEVEANVAAVRDAVGRAAERGADLVVTSELALSGYNIGPLSAERAEPVDGPVGQEMRALARRHGVVIAYGYVERAAEQVFNAVAVVDSDGALVANYRKAHLYGDLDRSLFAPGQEGVVQFELRGLTCGLAICYDVEFPEVARAHATSGTDLLVVPTGLMAPFEVVSRILVPARAYESQLFVAYVNRCDVEGELDYCGLSCVVGPDGEDLARAGADEELVVVDLDHQELLASRLVNTHLSDRRTDLFPPR